MEDEEEYRPKKKKGKSFWNFQRISLLVVFLVGLAIGVYITNQFIDPTFNASTAEENTQLAEINQRLDSQNDKYYSCLQIFEIDPESCTK